MKSLLVKARKWLAMPPRDMWIRLTVEFAPRLDFAPAGERERKLDETKLLQSFVAPDLDSLHARIMSQAMPWNSQLLLPESLDAVVPGEVTRILERAEHTMAGWVCLLGSGPVQIGQPGNIQWNMDFKSGLEWSFAYFHELDPVDLDRPSDVKVPWELSRMQWLIPVAQAWRLTGDDCYAAHLRAVMESWMASNSCAWGVNWSCTMEPAMRVFSWCWFYQMVADSPSWKDPEFRFRFLQQLYLHLAFVRRYIEITDINGNHLTAAASALVVGGVFFGRGDALKWKAEGWRLLKREIRLQVYNDGVNFEGSVPYHRLVTEFFHIAAVAIDINDEKVPETYRTTLLKMSEYIEAYMRPDGLAPVIGDNDDARILPMGGQAIGDHRYLPALVKYYWAPHRLTKSWLDNGAECMWWFGNEPVTDFDAESLQSRQFPEGGSYILRSNEDYVFFDCGPIGLAGRGGHGHNDMLSFEAILDGCLLVTDPGCPTYTGDWRLRNKFRSTAVHNTVHIDGAEINRFVSPRNLWQMHEDAQCKRQVWEDSEKFTLVGGCHSGYMRLKSPVTVERKLVLDKAHHAIAWMDSFVGTVDVQVSMSLQLAAFVQVEAVFDHYAVLNSQGRYFVLDWHWWPKVQVDKEQAVVSPQYGVTLPATRLHWNLSSVGDAICVTALYPGRQLAPALQESIFQTLTSCR